MVSIAASRINRIHIWKISLGCLLVSSSKVWPFQPLDKFQGPLEFQVTALRPMRRVVPSLSCLCLFIQTPYKGVFEMVSRHDPVVIATGYTETDKLGVSPKLVPLLCHQCVTVGHGPFHCCYNVYGI